MASLKLNIHVSLSIQQNDQLLCSSHSGNQHLISVRSQWLQVLICVLTGGERGFPVKIQRHSEKDPCINITCVVVGSCEFFLVKKRKKKTQYVHPALGYELEVGVDRGNTRGENGHKTIL